VSCQPAPSKMPVAGLRAPECRLKGRWLLAVGGTAGGFSFAVWLEDPLSNLDHTVALVFQSLLCSIGIRSEIA
jgi:hypothetical protein